MTKFNIKANNKEYDIEVEENTPLIFVLRNHLKLKGTKLGCSLEQCGACLVLADGEKTYSCTSSIKEVEGKNIITIEGLGTPKNMNVIQKAFVNHRAAQCGYCLPGIIIASKALLDKNPKPKENEIKEALSKNLCRCGSHNSIIKAILSLTNEVRE